MSTPSPIEHYDTESQLITSYLDSFRDQAISIVSGFADDAVRASQLKSGWTPLELLKHLCCVERRWLVWGFLGEVVAEPWGDWRDDRWFVASELSLTDVVLELRTQGQRTSDIFASFSLEDIGQPSERWEGKPAPALRRIGYHLIQEYARHLGHLDLVAEMRL